MMPKIKILKDQPLTISEMIDLYRNLSILLSKQEKQIKDMWKEILYWRNRPIEEENKKLKAENIVLMKRINSMQIEDTDKFINELRKERGLGPFSSAPNPSKIYLSVSTSKE